MPHMKYLSSGTEVRNSTRANVRMKDIHLRSAPKLVLTDGRLTRGQAKFTRKHSGALKNHRSALETKTRL